jgi:hypothetical protein
MNSKRYVYLALSLTLVTTPLFGTSANAKHRARHVHHRYHHQVAVRHYNTQRRAIDGVLVDRYGWRQTGSWDNSCFSLLYMDSMYACSGHSSS